MLAKRIIPCLDVEKGRVVKGTRFLDLVDAGTDLDLGGQVLQRPVRQLGSRGNDAVEVGDVGAHSRRSGEHLRDVEGSFAVLVDQPLVVDHGQQPERDGQREHHHRELQQQDLRCEPHIDAVLAGHSGSLAA